MMKSKKYHIFKMKKRVSECKKRLDALKDRGFNFPTDIYEELEEIKTRIIQPSLMHQMGNKKGQISAMVIFIIVTSIFLNSILPIEGGGPPILPLFTLSINNIEDDIIINDNYLINGTASYRNGVISAVQIKIDDNDWKNVTGTENWSYNLDVDNMTQGYHLLMFRCIGENENSLSTTRTIFVDNIANKPTVSMLNPVSSGVDLSGIININGTASGKKRNIKQVEIRFNGESWQNTTGAEEWSYNWLTTENMNGQNVIEVRSYDGALYSEISETRVIVYNEKNVFIPPYKENELLQFYIPPSDFLLSPNVKYEMTVYYRWRRIPMNPLSWFSYKAHLESNTEYDWLEISLSEESFRIYPNNETNEIKIIISITEDAPMDKRIPITFSFYYGFFDASKYPSLKRIQRDVIQDTYFFTGQW
ncbi:MAG: Ig-like domain-containing protein [Candidatus Thermoplasmatota archaeon]|nr:Ig-like domain-containing protein [Candidatus Thermoplasmatota archaeon]